MQVLLTEIKFVNEYYPRDGHDNDKVRAYRLNIDNLPPICLQKDEKILVDGYHRLLAHQLEERETIEAEIIDIPKENILFESTKRNSFHGLQLSGPEKKKLALNFFKIGRFDAEENPLHNGDDFHFSINDIADALSVTERTVQQWTEKLNDKLDSARDEYIFSLYLGCKTQEEIASDTSISQQRVGQIIENTRKRKISEISKDDWYNQFSIKYFNVWNIGKLDPSYGLNGVKGQIPGQIIENLLYFYTEPFDFVVDPMVGGGTTIDVARAMYRRWAGSDLYVKRPDLDIKEWDIREGYPKYPYKPDLIFLDPPYYNCMEDDFFNDLNEFYGFIDELVKNSFKTIKKGGIVAFLMCDQTRHNPEYLRGECYIRFKKKFGSPLNVISCPLSTQAANRNEMTLAKKHKRLLGRDRSLFIFRRPT